MSRPGSLLGPSGVPLPRRRALRTLRPPARWLFRRLGPVRVHDAHQVPAEGPVIVAANHIGVIDGPYLAAFTPRPVHALTKIEMFQGKAGAFFRWTGQVPLDRFHTDPAAVKISLALLQAGACVGIFPEGTRGAGDLARFHRGAAYLAMVSGAPVVPVTFVGTRAPGAGSSALPKRGGVVDIVFGAPWRVDAQPWPRTREQVGAKTALLQEHMVAGLAAALSQIGRELPGPLPGSPGTSEHDGAEHAHGRGA
ncbi:lysophospholipid acyltransferase family protein [Nocardioides daejeonensis]|uniref:lysophospholipid acyltransferase family protein n=1 Tax=Nocardioides daejeonensis TaxID=1046556 RepID=UPI001EF6BB5C|nr:lysophospholipid acyltransferase family protein [Nocardioides daejeonensis]